MTSRVTFHQSGGSEAMKTGVNFEDETINGNTEGNAYQVYL